MFPFATTKSPIGVGPSRSSSRDNVLARAPRLRDFGERTVASIVKALQTMAGATTTVEGMLASFESEKARAFIAANRPETAFGGIVLKDLACTIMATLDPVLVHAIVELLCGGNGAEPPPVTSRPITPIDQQFAQILVTLAASAIQTEWAEVGIGATRAEKIEMPLAADMFGARADEVGIVNMTIGIFGLHGSFRLVLPQAVLQRFAGEPSEQAIAADTQDPAWANLLQQEIGRAPVALAAYLEARDLSLGSLAHLGIGQILPLPVDARSRVSLISDGRVLYRGELGQDDNRYSIRIGEVVCEPTNVARLAARRASYYEESRV